jgi:hypothetical protein
VAQEVRHLGFDNVRKTAEMTTGIQITDEPTDTDLSVTILYEPYELLKPPRLVRRSIEHRPTIILEEVSIDVIEITPIRFCSKRYATIITDVATRAR